MKTSRLFPFLTLAILLFAISAQGQTKRPVKRPTPKPKPTPVAPLEVRTAREKVSNQIANVTRFTEVLGPIAAGIESLDTEAKTKKLKKSVFDANEANKKKVVEAIRNLRAGLVSLETEFRTKPALRKYLLKIEGITVLSAQSEDSAFAGKFTEARRPLLTVLQKLSDTFADMS